MGNNDVFDSQADDSLVFSYVLGEEAVMIPEYARYSQAMNNIETELKNLNVNRGGSINGNAGFVFEDMSAAKFNIESIAKRKGKVMDVVGNNDYRNDLFITDRKGNVQYLQAKSGYHGSNKYKISAEHYSDNIILYDKGNKELGQYLEKKDMLGEESTVSTQEAVELSGKMRRENKFENGVRQKVGSNNVAQNAPVIAKLKSLEYHAKATASAGLAAGKSSAAFAGGLSFGKNMYQFMEGDITLGEVISDTVKDTLKGFVDGFVCGSVSYAVGAVISKTAISGMIFGSTVGGVFVSIGGIVASMSAMMWPMFLAGMVIGAGYSMFQGIRYKTKKYKHQLSQINTVLNTASNIIIETYNGLDENIKATYQLWDIEMEKGLSGMLNSIKKNDFDKFSESLDHILKLYNSHAIFHTIDEFDEVFYNDNAVLVL